MKHMEHLLSKMQKKHQIKNILLPTHLLYNIMYIVKMDNK